MWRPPMHPAVARHGCSSEISMLVACWSSKGGAGTTVVATAFALLLARRVEGGAVLADLAGDVPAVLGLAEPDDPGIAGWLAAGPEVPVDALARLEKPVSASLGLLSRGSGPLEPARAEVLAGLLATDPRPVVADCGSAPDGVARTLAARAGRSILVTRACYVSLRRARCAPIRASEVVLVVEPGRSLTRRDVEDHLGLPVTAAIDVDPAVARAADAGLLATRLPRTLSRELSRVA